jgi:excisionase family DNA binding protein
MGNSYLLSTEEYREWVRIHEESPARPREDYRSPQPSLEHIPSLVSVVRQPVNAISSQPKQNVSAASDPFGVQEAARKLGCAPGFIRTLVHSGKLQHHLVGKNLKFRQADLEAYWASQTRIGAEKTKNSLKKLSVQNDRRKVEAGEKEVKKFDSEEVFPSREEFKKIWRS